MAWRRVIENIIMETMGWGAKGVMVYDGIFKMLTMIFNLVVKQRPLGSGWVGHLGLALCWSSDPMPLVSHHTIGITVRKCSIRVKIGDFMSRVTLKCEGWPWKTTGHVFYATLSSVHHCKAIGQFKLELQSGNAQFGSKSVILLSRVTLELDGWPWKTKGHLLYDSASFVYHFVAIWWIQSGNAQIESKSKIFLAAWPWNLTDDLEKQ